MKNIIKGALLTLSLGLSFSSCADFFETESTHVINANKDHLSVSADTIYSVIGILNKLQAIGDRTVLLGEARGDLMEVTDYTSSDLRDVALFNVGDDNEYNVPRDYYAVINNCNYFIAKADTALKNNRNQYLFRAEFTAVKAIRAWTYLQLAITYGKVPFVIDPILTKEDSEKSYPMYDIQQICNYFLHEDGLDKIIDEEYPNYGTLKGVPSRMFFIPMSLLLGDMNLWVGNYEEAALCYYHFITTYNGSNTYYTTGTSAVIWQTSTWTRATNEAYLTSLKKEIIADDTESIFIIPGDSVPSEGYYSQLRNIMSSSEEDYTYSLTPSKALFDLSEAQIYCHYVGNGNVVNAPRSLDDHMVGDLRLVGTWGLTEKAIDNNGDRANYQTIAKYSTLNIHLYRRQLVYLRLAEALNRAGCPMIAYLILVTGLDNDYIQYYGQLYPEKESFLAKLDFPSTNYKINYYNFDSNTGVFKGFGGNTIGIHSRGSGATPFNREYGITTDSTFLKKDLEEQMRIIEDLIVDEEALEFAFEGYRYYDLLRVALRREAEDPNYLANKIMNRCGGKDPGLKSSLTDKRNWFLHWNGQIGY